MLSRLEPASPPRTQHARTFPLGPPVTQPVTPPGTQPATPLGTHLGTPLGTEPGRPPATEPEPQLGMPPEARALFREYAATRDLALRDRLVLRYERLAQYLARRFARRGGAPYEDLVQVGYVGLIAAVERFDLEKGHSFVTYAVPTLTGMLKRYLRDHTWSLKVPRRLRELGITLRKVRAELEVQLGRPATLCELAERTGVCEERLAAALELERAYYAVSLDGPPPEDPAEEGACSWEILGEEDPRLQAVEAREMLRQAIVRLEKREQQVIYGRFYAELSQAQVAEQLGVSQMQVSRLERRALRRLRDLLSEPHASHPTASNAAASNAAASNSAAKSRAAGNSAVGSSAVGSSADARAWTVWRPFLPSRGEGA